MTCLTYLQLSGAEIVAGTLKGAPPTETGPIDFDCGAIRLRIASRLRARPLGMEEVISDIIALCSESIFAISVDSCEDTFFTSTRSSALSQRKQHHRIRLQHSRVLLQCLVALLQRSRVLLLGRLNILQGSAPLTPAEYGVHAIELR
ncbi:hypothetical protein ABIB06_005898 [Bradyrhizobium sp. LB8.2]